MENSSDMEPQKDIFTFVIDHFASEQEETRAAAAFAAGKQILTGPVSSIQFSLFHTQATLPSATCKNSYLQLLKW